MRVTRTALLPTLALASVVALAGCTQNGGTQTLSYEDSPLSAYLSAAWGSGSDMSIEEQQKQLDEQTREIEELTATCMKEAGFEYTPDVNNGGTITGDDGLWQPDSREWVAQYGFGVFNNPYADQQIGDGEEYVNPNQDYVSSLSESEQSAFYSTLSGESPTEEQANDPDFDWSALDRGCQGEANDQVSNSSRQQELYAEYEPLLQRVNDLYSTMQSSAEMKDLDGAWATCMSDAGQSGYTRQSEPSEKLYEAQNAFYEEQNTASENFDFENATSAEIEAFYAETDPTSTPEWKQQAEDEIEIALADFDCRTKTDYANKSLRLQFDAEEKFIADNKSELDAFKAAAEQANG